MGQRQRGAHASRRPLEFDGIRPGRPIGEDFVEHAIRGVARFVGASLIACVTLSPLAGAMFYVGREVRDLQKQHDWNMAGFDWPGFLWGVVPMAALEAVLRLS